MKKEYINPEIEIIEVSFVETQAATSGVHVGDGMGEDEHYD